MFKAAAALALVAPSLACEAGETYTKCIKEAAKDEHVILYEQKDFGGKWLDIHGLDFDQSQDAHFNWNNKAQSVRVGKGLKVTFCDHKDCLHAGNAAHSFTVVGPQEKADLGNWKNRITHVKVEEDVSVKESHVTLYDGYNCGGKAATFTKGDWSFYPFVRKIGNDRAKGINVPAGM